MKSRGQQVIGTARSGEGNSRRLLAAWRGDNCVGAALVAAPFTAPGGHEGRPYDDRDGAHRGAYDARSESHSGNRFSGSGVFSGRPVRVAFITVARNL